MPTNKSDQWMLLQYPALVFLIGTLLFYSQTIFSWWTYGAPANTFLAIGSVLILLGGFFIFGVLFSRALREAFKEMASFEIWTPLIIFSSVTVLAFFFLGAFSAIKPAHGFTEGDFLDYHLFIPKQNWIRGNWAPIDWHPNEFLSLTLDNALSFFWVSIPLLNRAPQFLIQCFLALKILYAFSFFEIKRPFAKGFCALLALLSFRAVIIQVGTSMLDLVNLYFGLSTFLFLIVASVCPDLSLSRWKTYLISLLFGVDLAAYLSHKSFGVIYVGVVLVILETLFRITRKQSFILSLKGIPTVPALVSIAVIWIPTLIRSFKFTGDPLYPVLSRVLPTRCVPGQFVVRQCEDNSLAPPWFVEATQQFGFGHDWVALVKSFFLAPLPSPLFSRQGFFFGQNKFDYPLGIFWYFAWAVFFYAVFREKNERRTTLVGGTLMAFLYLFWFGSSQQGRWLYPVMLILSMFWGHFWMNDAREKKWISLGILGVTLAVGLNAVKIPLSQWSTLGCYGSTCLKFQEELYRDFNTPCSTEELQWSRRNHLGYLNCPVKTPRSDFPWIK